MFQIIISPAKKMTIDTDSFAVRGMPQFLEDTKVLMGEIQALSLVEAKALWKWQQGKIKRREEEI